MIFQYEAINKDGKEVSGLVDATSEQEAAKIIQSKGLNILFIKKKAAKKKKVAKQLTFVIGGKIKTKDLVIFFRQFSVMISANVSMVDALKIIVIQTVNVKLKMLLSEIADEVDGGSRLSDVMSRHPKIFSNFYTSVIRGGETSGKLSEALNYLADEMEKDYDMMSKIRGAMVYPVFVFSGLIIVGIVMMVFVIPKLTNVLAESGTELPIATKILIGTSDILRDYWFLLIILLIGSGFLIKFLASTSKGAFLMDYGLLHLPIFGPLFQKIYIVRFARSMDTLLSGGITVPESLEITSNVVNNKVYSNLLSKAKKEVDDGSTVSSTLEGNKSIPEMVSQMIGIGEKTGKLDVVLARVADFYGREVNNTIANLMTVMEPLIMIIMGIAVGIMVAAIILPMYNMASQAA